MDSSHLVYKEGAAVISRFPAAKVVSPGRTFCRRLFDAASSLDRMDEAGSICPDAMDDITWWHACIEDWNGKAILAGPVWHKPVDAKL